MPMTPPTSPISADSLTMSAISVPRVASSGRRGLVFVVAVGFQPGFEAFLEAGDGVAVPVLERVGGERDAGASALVGEDGDLVDEVGVLGPAGRDHAGGGVPDVLGVEPDHNGI